MPICNLKWNVPIVGQLFRKVSLREKRKKSNETSILICFVVSHRGMLLPVVLLIIKKMEMLMKDVLIRLQLVAVTSVMVAVWMSPTMARFYV